MCELCFVWALQCLITLQFTSEVLEERGNLLRVPSQESMASTDHYHDSNASSMVHVRPAYNGANAGYDDDDDDSAWQDDDNLQKSMPSHQFRSIRGLPSENAFKQGVRKTLKMRVNNSRASIRSFSHDSSDEATAIGYEDEVIRGMDLTSEEFAELTKRRKSIKEMPTSIRRKRSLRYATGFTHPLIKIVTTPKPQPLCKFQFQFKILFFWTQALLLGMQKHPIWGGYGYFLDLWVL